MPVTFDPNPEAGGEAPGFPPVNPAVGADTPAGPNEGGGGGEEGGGGGGPSPEEAALLGALTEILGIQASHLRDTTQLFHDLLPSFRELFLAQNAYGTESINLMRAALPAAFRELGRIYTEELGPLARVSETETLATQNVNKYLRGETLLTSEDMGRLDTIFARAREQGTQDIQRFGEEQAAARGLRVTDTPVGATAQEQIRQLSGDLGASRAQAELGLEQSRFQNAAAIQQFQENLRAAASSNRAALAAGFIPGFKGGGGTGASLPTIGSADTGGAFSFLGTLSGQRNAQAMQNAALAFQGNEGNLNRANATNIANINNAGHSPGALDWLGLIGKLGASALSLW